MLDIDPIFYRDLYYNAILLICLVFISISSINKVQNKITAIFLFLLVVCFIGFRPISIVFGDTVAYARGFLQFNLNETISGSILEIKDVGWTVLSLLLAPTRNVTLLFVICALLYVGPPYIAFKSRYKSYYSVALLIFICSFSFWGFGVNGLRNGISTSFLIWALYSRKNLHRIILFFVAFSMHKSALLPIAAYLISMKFDSKKLYIYIWCTCVVISFAVGPSIASYIEMLDIFGSDNRLSSYIALTAGQSDISFSHTGFRFDFLLYSAVPIYMGYRYLSNVGKNDRFYLHLFITYLICNTFWLFTIYVPYNNRFAYLSWFLYPILIAHPYLTRMEENPSKNIYRIIKPCIFLNYAFTYFMFIK